MTAKEIAEGLSDIERKWFTATTWGSWVYGVGQDLIAKGLTYKRDGSILLTPLGEEVAAMLRSNKGEEHA